jgi:uncharacterized membrane protein
MDVPLHPSTVHFPIAFLFAALGFYLVSIFREDSFYARGGFSLHILGVGGLAVAILSGRQAESALASSDVLTEMVDRHELMGYLCMWLMAMLLVWQFLRKDKRIVWEKSLFLVLFAASLVIMSLGAHIGGEMVYLHGAGVQAP